jgi:hypothetical protein
MVKTGIYVRNKDEANIIEFMEHYYSIGFEFILMLDDYSKIHPSLVIGDKFQGKYKIIRIDSSIIYNHDSYSSINANLREGGVFDTYILPEIKNYMDYCLYIDMDEYLVIKKYKNINAVIEFYQPFDQLKINWILFGNNDIKFCEDLSKLKPLFTKSELKFNQHVKSLVKVNSIKHNNNPHIFNVNGITKNVLNQITVESPFEGYMTNFCFKEIDIYIAHYITLDTTSCVKRRYCRTRPHNIDALVGSLNYIDNKSIIKTELLKYINNNINRIVDYAHGVHDNVGVFLSIYKDVLPHIKGFFRGHNKNESNNFDLSQQYIYQFCWKYYLGKYPDLRANGIHSEAQALEHWNNHGKHEGRISNP